VPIRILADEVASQIAAGEVVERPASVVKELLENGLDAKAREIRIRVEQAGKRLIEVSDDGSGISFPEVELAVARHATSKLYRAEDLFNIHTLGFRGEALASIGSVSQMTIITRCEDSRVGARLVVTSGKTLPIEQVGVPTGTVVQVENLFFNVPARLKFLKSDQTERNQINNLVIRYALAYPEVRFLLTQDDKKILHTTGSGQRREILAQFYGADSARKMLELSLEDESTRITGFISPVGMTRSNRRELTFFVNGRWVVDTGLSSALFKAYQTLIMVGRFPIAVLFLELKSEDVDINVHPAKAEIRFRQPDQVFGLVQRAVRRALTVYSSPPPISAPYWKNIPSQNRSLDPAWGLSAGAETAFVSQPPASVSGSTNSHIGMPVSPALLLRVVGQIGAAYIVAEGPDGLYLIDQHAAHERVLFERLMVQKSDSIASQNLLEAVTVQLSPSSAQLLLTQIPLLKDLGFGLEEFGPHTFRIRAVPAILTGIDPTAAVRLVVEDFEEDEAPLQSKIEERLVARICKRAAVKAGQLLSIEEQRTLVRELETCNSPRTCPHGRPTMIYLSVDLLERQFGRRGSL